MTKDTSYHIKSQRYTTFEGRYQCVKSEELTLKAFN